MFDALVDMLGAVFIAPINPGIKCTIEPFDVHFDSSFVYASSSCDWLK